MEKDNDHDDLFDLEWQEDFEDIVSKPQTQRLFQLRDSDIFGDDIFQEPLSVQRPSPRSSQNISSPLLKQQMVTQISQAQTQWKSTKRQHPSQPHIHLTSKTNSKSQNKDLKSEKQQTYSKTYRERKKEQFKILQEENAYLKKRIGELESQLRQQQIELNRFKFPPKQKEVTIDELNRDLMSATITHMDELKTNPIEQKKQVYKPGDYYYQWFIDGYNERGFGGSRKIKILNYHFNELLQAFLRDSEKYLSLMYVNSKSYDKLMPLPQFQPITNAYLDVFKSEGDLWHRLKEFNKFLKPMSMKINILISQFYKKFEEILSCCETIHNFLRETYLRNVDVVLRRLEMQKWFDFHQYGRTMRKLRNQWFEWMKTLAQQQEQSTTKKGKKGSKRKKLESEEQQ